MNTPFNHDNTLFDTVGARESLAILSEENTNGINLATVAQTTGWTDSIRATRVEHPTTWRLLQGGNNSHQEEIVFTIRGVVISKDLPPMLQRPRLSQGRYKYLRQGVTVSGLGTPKFDQGMRAACELYGIFDRTFADGQMESWSASNLPGPNNCLGLDASNRYMTPRRDVPNAPHIPFPAPVDPKGILESMVDPDYVRTEENDVLYFTSRVNETGRRIFEVALPQIFRLGDIVELQVSFVVVPLKNDQYKMVTVLRSIALLDGRFGQTSAKNRKVTRMMEPSTSTVLSVKRRVGYGSAHDGVEEETGPHKKLQMEVDDATNPLVERFTTQLIF